MAGNDEVPLSRFKHRKHEELPPRTEVDLKNLKLWRHLAPVVPLRSVTNRGASARGLKLQRNRWPVKATAMSHAPLDCRSTRNTSPRMATRGLASLTDGRVEN